MFDFELYPFCFYTDGDMIHAPKIEAFCASEEFIAARKPGCTTTVTGNETSNLKVKTCIVYCSTKECNNPLKQHAK